MKNSNIKNTGIKMYMLLMRAVCGTKKKVLFDSFLGRQYSDNPRAVSEKLHELYPDIEIEWLVRSGKASLLPDYVKPVYMDNFRQHYKALATSKVILENFGFPDIPKGKKQYFIQTWHGDRAFKKIQYDNPHLEAGFYRPESKEGFCDLCVAGSDYGVRKFRSAFRYKGEILSIGTPRDDLLVQADADEIRRIRSALQVPDKARILMYAPTIRKAQLKGMEIKDLNVEGTLKCLEEKYACPWVCFMRSHPGVKELSGVEYSDRIIDVSAYEDMTDLLLASDMLISDYSSCAGDFALLGRPLVLFQADREDYLKNEREFYFNIQDSPYWVAESQMQLEEIISGWTEDSVKSNCQAVLDFYGTHESGDASEHLAKLIASKIGE